MNAPRTETGNATLRRSQTTRRLESAPRCAEYRFSWPLLHITTDHQNSSSWPRSCHQIATCRCSMIPENNFQAAAVPWKLPKGQFTLRGPCCHWTNYQAKSTMEQQAVVGC